MPAKKHGSAAAPSAKDAVIRSDAAVSGERTRFVKRSITVRPDVDRALREIAAGREYSQVANEAFVLYVQARGIDAIVKEIEASSGPITAEERAEADRRLEDAHRRAEQRQKTRR
jgi:hypothetical protein